VTFDELKAAVERLKDSSHFASGDPTTFSVTFLRHELELPGPSDPERYLDLCKRKFQLEIADGAEVAVVCPGNGGLCAEAFLAGAKRVLAIEPRPRFADAIDKVMAHLQAVEPERDSRTFRAWPQPTHGNVIDKFDLIFWPEGLEETTTPLAILESVLKLLKPQGALVVEVMHGQQDVPSTPTINSWRPTRAAFVQVGCELTGEKMLPEVPGRTGRTIYLLLPGGEIPKATPKKPDPLPAFPRDPDPKVVYSTKKEAPTVPPPAPSEDSLPAPAPTAAKKRVVKKSKPKPKADD
jgi:SAM-dependent methyltransferase